MVDDAAQGNDAHRQTPGETLVRLTAGVVGGSTKSDLGRSMTPSQFFDYLAVRLDSDKARGRGMASTGFSRTSGSPRD
ncbi:alkyl sulfatase C-terminal domain-containing protein [Pseudomonas sp. MAHUQ-62]|uniref:alkyl sulfatase C-terminal domain-containing protein n=1 Tax=Pseudomonas sp. GCM10023245 TaxID=3252652 RepID=UPI0036231709